MELLEEEFINTNVLTALMGPCLDVEGDTLGRIRDMLDGLTSPIFPAGMSYTLLTNF